MQTVSTIIPALEETHAAAALLRNFSRDKKSKILLDLAELIGQNKQNIIGENQRDLALMDTSDSKYDRLKLTEERLQDIVVSLKQVAQLADPSGQLLTSKILENGLKLEKISVPMGVVATIFESRPNVTIDVAALCIMSGNAAVLKGGKEALFSNTVLTSLIHKALEKNGLPTACVLLLPSDRKHMLELLHATRYVDLIIPRGSQALIDFVRENSKIPTIETGAGVCHTYVHEQANLDMAAEIVINAKASRPSVCNSLDSIIVDKSVLSEFLGKIKSGIEQYNISIYADEPAFEHLKDKEFKQCFIATEEDFGKEWLDFKLSIKTVNNYKEALSHINKYSSRHSEAVITEDKNLAEHFLQEVDAAAVYVNASTRFTDGSVFDLGAEIGISTQKLHARGPFALEKLVTEKWIVRGNGQTRW